jgi:hypothetical protein
MKFRLLQTILIAATIVTWATSLQAFNTFNDTPYQLLVQAKTGSYSEWVNPKTTSNGWNYNGTITLYALARFLYKGTYFYTPTLTCIVPPHGQQIVTLKKQPTSPNQVPQLSQSGCSSPTKSR